MYDDDDFYYSPADLEPDSPDQLARDLAAIAWQEEVERNLLPPPAPDQNITPEPNLIPLTVDFLSLPNDIITQIFDHACRPIAGDKEWRRSFYPLWLGRICRAWRDIAWESSEIWATVVVRVFDKERSGCNYTVQAELLEEWLARAKGRKLSFYLGEAKGNCGMRPPYSLMGLMMGCSEQWQDVHFDMSKPWWSMFTLAATVRPFPEDVSEAVVLHQARTRPTVLPLPNLRSISIHRSQLEQYSDHMLNLSLAPSLRSVGLFYLPTYVIDGIADYIPCARITELALTINHTELRDVLRHFPRLQSLSLIDCAELQIRRSARHETLRNLIIHCKDEWNWFSTFGKAVTFPALQSLEIIYSRHINYVQVLLPFILRSKCHLTSLTIECILLAEHDLIDLLFSLDTLSELHIRDSESRLQRYATMDHNNFGLGRTFFDVLHPDEEAPFLPNLEVFSYRGPLAVQAIDFIEPFIVRSRMRGAQIADIHKVALLKQAVIVADQYSDVAEFSIAEYSDPQYIWELVRMVEEGVLVLHNMDGSRWS
ncbi:hypothetical protein BDN70DRAFT_276119 [Pholiota conissans]|uniref:F-box domain-containing protein n=1 Tax=Pholiota conissans TaxID=109636 RepID=A0A9P5ZB53_9AGAR|nr:hypothetical protein BDN70DRAFT_276119 [Pholiota conissans]